jgi:alpha-tubulin suppressor-like RCC1 family protein
MTRFLSKTVSSLLMIGALAAANPRISSTVYHGLKVNADGTVTAWGENQSGQLGDGTRISKISPVQVVGLTNVIAVSAGFDYSLALRGDGTVWAWGSNSGLQLGQPGIALSVVPLQVQGLSGVVAIAAGHGSFAIRADGTVWGWGTNYAGTLGSGLPYGAQTATPVQVVGLSNIRSLAAGTIPCYALRKDGVVMAWGDYGNTPSPASAVHEFAGLSGFVDLNNAGTDGFFTLALKNDGTVWGWGFPDSGVLGPGLPDGISAAPRQLPGVSGVKSIAACNHTSVFIKSDGSVRRTSLTEGQSEVPGGTLLATFSFPGAVEEFACGRTSFFALLTDGSTYAIGDSPTSGSGIPPYRATPTSVAGLAGSTAIRGGSNHTMALRPDGTVLTVGDNFYGQVGLPGTRTQLTPVPIPGLSGITRISTKSFLSLALRQDGTVSSWGSGAGQLGDPAAGGRRDAPGPVTGLTGVTEISAGETLALALKSDGSVWAWGRNDQGQVNGQPYNPFSQPTATQVPGLPPDMMAVEACSYYGLGLQSNGTVWAWGARGALSEFEQDPVPLPPAVAPVPGLSGIVKISCSGYSLALGSDGKVWIFGRDNVGGLRIDQTLSPLPTPITNVKGVVDIAAGPTHALLLLADGSVWSWGDNRMGQLGDGTTIARARPAPVPGVTNAKSIATASERSFATLRDGTVLAWGSKSTGLLGNGEVAASATPLLQPGIAPLDLGVAALPPLAVRAGGKTSVTFNLSNAGGMSAAGTTTFTVTLGPGLSWTGTPVAAWNCSSSAQTVSCGSAEGVRAYSSVPVTLELNVSASAVPSTTLTAVVSAAGDLNPANNSVLLSLNVLPPPVGAVPTLLPAASTGLNSFRRSFQFTVRDTDGAANVWYAQMQIADPKTAFNSCLIHYDAGTNVFYLRNDDDTDWWGLYAGTNTRIGNSQCELYAAGSGAAKSGTDLVITMDISFRGAFAGDRNLYLRAGDRDSNVTDWQQVGTARVTADPSLLELLSVAPLTGAGREKLFTMTLRDGDGAGKVWFAQLNINATNTPAHSCYVHHDPATNIFYLLGDDGATWFGLRGATTGTVQNSQCVLRGKDSTRVNNGNDLTVTFDLQFKDAYVGQKEVFARASDLDGNLVQWKSTGAWRVQ